MLVFRKTFRLYMDTPFVILLLIQSEFFRLVHKQLSIGVLKNSKNFKKFQEKLRF